MADVEISFKRKSKILKSNEEGISPLPYRFDTLPLVIEVEKPDGSFTSVDCLVAAGGLDFTTIPQKFASEVGIEFSTEYEIQLKGAFATGKAFTSKIRYRFRELKNVVFETMCTFTTAPLHGDSRAFLHVSELNANFEFSSGPSTATNPHGTLELTLRSNHRGEVAAEE